ncbi:FAD:protein FMN transferase [Patulibacter sp. NPDC049589]|uniref:FAD:protein FMN transferase n=1 Tax=Patulibacter sp. NPDC049589 TaxID=3154731 RepID=UPI003438A854
MHGVVALRAWHDRFTRFQPTSELSRLNADPSPTVRVSRTMGLLLRAVGHAGRASGGLVDATLLDDLREAGYTDHHDGRGVPLRDALAAAPTRVPATPRPGGCWDEVRYDAWRGWATRPPGLGIDGGGLVKGLAADVLAARLVDYDRFVVNCCGDLRIGGRSGDRRPVRIESPFDGREIHRFDITDDAVATSGIGRRSWTDVEGRPAHHLLDPGTGRPAFTGVVQASALAPTALEAEWRSKAALLSGPEGGPRWLAHGGLLVLDDGTPVVATADRTRSEPACR